jgi:hypothetical protein
LLSLFFLSVFCVLSQHIAFCLYIPTDIRIYRVLNVYCLPINRQTWHCQVSPKCQVWPKLGSAKFGVTWQCQVWFELPSLIFTEFWKSGFPLLLPCKKQARQPTVLMSVRLSDSVFGARDDGRLY